MNVIFKEENDKMKKKISVSFAVSEHTKILIDKLAHDKNISKSKLIEDVVLDYFDSKKDDLVIEKMNENVEEMKQNFKDLNYKTGLILEKIGDFDEKKMVEQFVKKFQEMGE